MKLVSLKIVLGLALATVFAVPVTRAQATDLTHRHEGVRMRQAPEPSENPQAEKRSAEEEQEQAFRRSPSVIKLGAMLGMKPEVATLVFEWFNSIVLFAALFYGLAKALPKTFRSRTEGIQKNIIEARVATEEAKARLAAVEGRLGKLDGEIAALRAETERAAAEEEARIRAQAEEEKKRIVEAAEQEIAAASAAATRDLRAYAAEIAVDRAAAQLHITPEDDHVLIESFAGRVSTLKPGAEGSRN